MIEDKYEVWDGNTMLADNMRIDVAMIFVRALFEEWFRETGLELKIRRKVDELATDEEKNNVLK